MQPYRYERYRDDRDRGRDRDRDRDRYEGPCSVHKTSALEGMPYSLAWLPNCEAALCGCCSAGIEIVIGTGTGIVTGAEASLMILIKSKLICIVGHPLCLEKMLLLARGMVPVMYAVQRQGDEPFASSEGCLHA